jgi:hypothetical protein
MAFGLTLPDIQKKKMGILYCSYDNVNWVPGISKMVIASPERKANLT